MINQIKNIKSEVIRLLTKFPHLRDSDTKLIATIWGSDIGKDENGLIAKQITAFLFLEQFANGKFTSPESIRRIRQKIQEQNEELRGESYKARKEHAQIIKQEIKNI